ALVDRKRLAELQQSCRLVEAEELFRAAFWEDVRPVVREWRRAHKLSEDPLQALAESGHVERVARERGEKNACVAASYA
ncbi:MAG TPA: sugar isomerase, partial [Acidobacteriaceae bacterium]|nr:sugar isomerase [Acidobacteriaceae bacterium]